MLPILLVSAFVVQASAFSSSFAGFGTSKLLHSSAGQLGKCAGGVMANRKALPISGLRMGGGNVPRVPYKAPGEDSYQAEAYFGVVLRHFLGSFCDLMV